MIIENNQHKLPQITIFSEKKKKVEFSALICLYAESNLDIRGHLVPCVMHLAVTQEAPVGGTRL